MHKATIFVSKLLYNKFFWQLILAAFMIAMAAFFINHEHLELLQIRKQLSQSNGWYVALGVLLTGLYILLQGQMYVHCFNSLDRHIRLRTTTTLFLKRNLIRCISSGRRIFIFSLFH